MAYDGVGRLTETSTSSVTHNTSATPRLTSFRSSSRTSRQQVDASGTDTLTVSLDAPYRTVTVALPVLRPPPVSMPLTRIVAVPGPPA